MTWRKVVGVVEPLGCRRRSNGATDDKTPANGVTTETAGTKTTATKPPSKDETKWPPTRRSTMKPDDDYHQPPKHQTEVTLDGAT